ncbi:MAG: hypothetical protein HQ528_05605 [Candidatus Marinimicrobia bacterium]|nr:hypothetical protein [Candidatus Neomarinimicrobiota bacterium]
MHHVPLSNAIKINRNTSITLWFSELMDETSVIENVFVYPRADLDSIQTIATADDDPNKLYLGRLSHGVFTSTDAAENWVWITSKTLKTSVPTLAVSNLNSDIVYAGTSQGVYKSLDAGDNWTQMNSGLTDKSIQSIAVSPIDDVVVYLLTNTAGVFKTEDGGLNWVAKNNGVNFSQPLHSIIVSPTNSDILFMATSGNYILRSIDAGETWTRQRNGLGSRYYYSVAVHPLNDNVIFAGSYADGIFMSTDGGDNWLDINNNLGNGVINAIALDPIDTNTVYVGTDGGIFKTSNATIIVDNVSFADWVTIGSGWGSTPIKSLLVHPVDNTLLFTCIQDDGIYKSTDAGETWIKKSKLTVDNLLVKGNFEFEVWQDSTTIITLIDSVLSDTTIIHPYVLERALEGWDGTGEPPVETNPEASKLIFQPDSTLIPDCNYQVKVKGKFQSDDETLQTDPAAAMDLNGNSFESDANFNFTTGD